MKKTMLLAAFAAALSFASCTKEIEKDFIDENKDEVTEETQMRTITFSTKPIVTKTVFGEKDPNTKVFPTLWETGDKIRLNINHTDQYQDVTVEPSADGTSARFEASVPTTISSADIRIVSPYASFKTYNNSNHIMVEIPPVQASTTTGPDPDAQILFANTVVTDLNDNSSVQDLEFDHLTAYLHIKFTNVNLGQATVQAVNVSYDDEYICGRLYYQLGSSPAFDGDGSSRFKIISVTTSSLDDVWCSIRPLDFSNKTMTVQIVTDNGTMSKDIHFPASANLAAGKAAKFTVDMTGITLTSPVKYELVNSASNLHYGDEIIIAAAGDDYPYGLSTGQNGNNRSGAGVTKSGSYIIDPINTVELITVGDGAIPGTYSLHATTRSGYLYAAGTTSGNNYLRTKDALDLRGSWDISFEPSMSVNSVTYTNCAVIVSSAQSSTINGIIRYNTADNLFSAYGDGTKQMPVRIYRKQSTPDSTPRFSVTMPDATNGAISKTSRAAATYDVYIFGNSAWTASLSGDSGATLSKSSGTGAEIITITAPQNNSNTKKEYVLTVTSSLGSQSFTITESFVIFPAKWSFPERSTLTAETDYHLQTGCYGTPETFLFADEHEAKLIAKTSATKASSNNPTYTRRGSGDAFEGRVQLLTYCMGRGSCWEFQVYNVSNPAGSYTVDFCLTASGAGPKYFILEYSTDGTNWVADSAPIGQCDDDLDSGNKVDYSFALEGGQNVENHISKAIEVPAIEGTLYLRAKVCSKIRCNGAGDLSDNSGGTHRIFCPNTGDKQYGYIDFTPAS